MCRWILDENRDSFYVDILDFNGKVYAVDDRGRCITLETLDLSLNVTEVASPLNVEYKRSFRKKYLAESSGELLLLDQYLNAYSNEIDHDTVSGVVYARKEGAVFEVPVYFVVYKLDTSEGKWVCIDNLQDRVILVSPDCTYSISVNDFDG
ncbi:hypothetical protein Vadar_016878 [Vaccinium darrowii]|uniref:Uncharacterized protein n=1 Tax=Vaccinium darrowii TaxID=229202 RepID=A0ACB7ZKQ7_9ERIC|nr:hypothetical protein Vadar_016878 [Vaccinium darrowii]